MSDNHTKEVRSYNMSQIKSTNTNPEETVRKYLFSKGMRYRKNDKRYAGNPDIVLPKYKTIIFVNGCFWHMHEECNKFVMPKSNIKYWVPKLLKNKARDKKNEEILRGAGWNVITIWECQLQKNNRIMTLENLYLKINNNII